MNEQYQYLGFWPRVAATLIDSLLILMITWPVLFSVYGMDYFLDAQLVRGPLDLMISWVLPVLATLVFWRTRSATPGKMLFKAVIIDVQTGQAPSSRQLLVRYFAYLVSILPCFLGFLWIGWDKQKQGWHDKLAGTAVVIPLGDND